MKSKHRLAIFASGSGSNAEQIINYFKQSETVSVPIILSNKKEAYVHERAKKLGIPSVSFNKTEFYQTNQVLEILQQYDIDTIILAGFLWLVPKNLLEAFRDRMINIHPALLPSYGGKGMYGHHIHQAVVKNKETTTGITIHLVNEEYDKGKILFQAQCAVEQTDTADDVASKIHTLEYEHFPRIIEDYLYKEN